jgi:hypothetical protein
MREAKPQHTTSGCKGMIYRRRAPNMLPNGVNPAKRWEQR